MGGWGVLWKVGAYMEVGVRYWRMGYAVRKLGHT